MTFQNTTQHRFFMVLENYRNSVKKGDIGYKDGVYFISILHPSSMSHVTGDFEIEVASKVKLICEFTRTVECTVQ